VTQQNTEELQVLHRSGDTSATLNPRDAIFCHTARGKVLQANTSGLMDYCQRAERALNDMGYQIPQ
jgi:hypothetical protein